MSLSFNPKSHADPKTERSSQPSYGLHKDSFAILNEHAGHLASLYYKTDEDKTDEVKDKAFIEEITQWKAELINENKKRCDVSFLKNSFIKNSFVNTYCYIYEAMKNAEPEDIKSYIKNNYILTGGKRKSLRPHKKSKKRKQTKHMKKGKNGKKSKTKKVKRSRH